MRRLLPRRGALLAAIAAGPLAACHSINLTHSIDDLKSVHGVTSRELVHRFDVERYPWTSALLVFGFLDWVPGASDVSRTNQHLEDPAEFCWDRVTDLLQVRLANVAETAEVIYWAGAVVEGDPFPLSRLQGIRVLGLVVARDKPDLAILAPSDLNYQAATASRLELLNKLLEASLDGKLDAEQRRVYLDTIVEIGRTPFARASQSRQLARSLATTYAAETDREIRAALATASGVLVARGALQQLDRALADPLDHVRIAAAREMVATLGRGALVHVVARLREDRDASVRAAVAELAGSVARVGDPGIEGVFEYLALATRDTESVVSVNAMEALGRISGVGRQFDVDWWRRWWERHLLERGAAGAR